MKHRFYLSFKGLDYRPDVQVHIWPLEHSYHADVISDGQCMQLRLGVTKDDVDRISWTRSSTLEHVARGEQDRGIHNRPRAFHQCPPEEQAVTIAQPTCSPTKTEE
jgi:hypothetical protein